MKRWQFWLGVAISAILLWWALRNFQLGEVWTTLQGAEYGWLIPGVAVYMLAVWARTWRWHYLLRPLKRVSIRTMFPIVAIGYMGNNIYPARAGELLRAYVLRKREGISISASLATIIVERAFDGIVMLAFVFLNLPELANLTGESGFVGDIRSLALVGAGVFLFAVFVFLLMAIFPDRSISILNKIIDRVLPGRFQAPSRSLIERFHTGLASLRSPKDVLMVLVTSVIIWLFETWKYWFVMHAFSFNVSFFTLMLMNGIVNLATTIPSAPGYIGTFDAPGIKVLEGYGVPGAVAAGYTLVLHAALWLPITLLGAFYMAREQLSWQSVQEEIAEERES
ncbi:MAG: TIGR00374 family protein [Chloroflexi bacterium RBG_16_48_8]|nr:MAG: TIGR00374 family protein [Chloroflexi bacterium RBG_16_48_8]